MNIDYILDNYDISRNVLIDALKLINIDDILDIKSSNGLSFVFILKNEGVVYQYFINRITFDRITNLYNNIDFNISKTFYEGRKKYLLEYNLQDFIPKLNKNIPSNIIIWDKILCLNSFKKNEIEDIIMNNYVKIIWDINKALYGLYMNNIVHNDTRIDNIGIKNDKFVLFDFDGSVYPTIDTSSDSYDLQQSMSFYITKSKNLNKITEYFCYSSIAGPSFVLDFIILKEKTQYGLNTIEAIHKLENLKIIL
jgi:hypothetical protein